MSSRETLDALLEEHGTTYAEEAGIRLRDTPQPLYQLLVLSHLLSARIRASVAVASARALFSHGMRSPRRMADATWQQRVDALGEGGYRRYDERTATQLGDGAELLLDAYGGDLRRLRGDADGDTDALRSGLRRFPGMGPAGADIFLREVQAVWPEAAPYLDSKALQGAERLGLPTSPTGLRRLADGREPAVLAAALVRAALDKDVVDSVRPTG
ncbi:MULTISPECIES: endonuclease [unclassified Streptomyces]|uniref:endonuclease n=1 Tax=unclassified Streptomyces TaxID=2593676 RepID=UPI0001C1B195|nr:MULTISPECIES: endonuclease [unclassified Streptomyces]MYR66802.1 endonuclease [Streptomyces sp. SID4939]MYS03603.1 endonuclease [Streptomyces sp. SID4940]MYT66016.1 endonuclease [Streptomyces sp. SID8357]MYT88908.1 endonuclease [Streptomyces sp. SID8360]MYU37478.1 endonuclease [Streptomyces sp. SID8358]MYW41619.1 endonuclease [Streptomyces sp. SID1]